MINIGYTCVSGITWMRRCVPVACHLLCIYMQRELPCSPFSLSNTLNFSIFRPIFLEICIHKRNSRAQYLFKKLLLTLFCCFLHSAKPSPQSIDWQTLPSTLSPSFEKIRDTWSHGHMVQTVKCTVQALILWTHWSLNSLQHQRLVGFTWGFHQLVWIEKVDSFLKQMVKSCEHKMYTVSEAIGSISCTRNGWLLCV